MAMLAIGAVNTRAAAKSHRLGGPEFMSLGEFLSHTELDALRLFFGPFNPAYFSDRHQNRYH